MAYYVNRILSRVGMILKSDGWLMGKTFTVEIEGTDSGNNFLPSRFNCTSLRVKSTSLLVSV